jgi:methylmalonyl-CoA/ethylmalonyl-CoA epimerase
MINGEFHHLGIACRDLEVLSSEYQALGYEQEGDEFVDNNQHVRGRFFTGPGPRVELLVESDDTRVLEPWLKNGTRVYHQAFLVEDLEKALLDVTNSGAHVVVEPVEAVAFQNRKIAFAMTRNLQLIEFIEAE